MENMEAKNLSNGRTLTTNDDGQKQAIWKGQTGHKDMADRQAAV